MTNWAGGAARPGPTLREAVEPTMKLTSIAYWTATAIAAFALPAPAIAPRDLQRHQGEYGLDGSVPPLFALAAAGLGLARGAMAAARAGRAVLAAVAALNSAVLLSAVAFYLHATRRGKFAVWADLLAHVQWRGTERVLDLGCGRGAVLAIAARCVPRGRVIGLDLWTTDQSGNSPNATRQNLAAEQVSERCAVVTGTMLALPFRDGSFDVVTSSLAIHNIDQFAPTNHRRLRAVDEAVRVLAPRGRLLIADLMWTARYAQRLRTLGMDDVQRRGLGWRFWYGPGMGASLVTATMGRI